MKIFDLEIGSGVYVSDKYQMFVNKHDREFQREITKTYFIEDKKKRVEKMRDLLRGKDEFSIETHTTKNELPQYDKYFKNYKEYVEELNKSMFYNVWVEVSTKRALEIEVYVEDIYNKADELNKENSYSAFSYLVDEQYKEHTGIFDNEKSDFVFKEQYNQIIYDLLNNKIKALYELKYNSEFAREIEFYTTQRKPLVWNASKTSLGTLFGLLHSRKIISGTLTDVQRGLMSMFNNISESTLKDNLSLKINTAENKTLYDTKTEALLKKWIDELVSTTKSKKANGTKNP